MLGVAALLIWWLGSRLGELPWLAGLPALLVALALTKRWKWRALAALGMVDFTLGLLAWSMILSISIGTTGLSRSAGLLALLTVGLLSVAASSLGRTTLECYTPLRGVWLRRGAAMLGLLIVGLPCPALWINWTQPLTRVSLWWMVTAPLLALYYAALAYTLAEEEATSRGISRRGFGPAGSEPPTLASEQRD